MSEENQVVHSQVLLKWDACHSILVMDPRKHDCQYFQIFMFPKDLQVKKGSRCPECRALCGHKLKRFHVSGLRCRLIRVYFGKMENPLQVTPYVILLRYRNRQTFMDQIIKHLLTLLEFLDNL